MGQRLWSGSMPGMQDEGSPQGKQPWVTCTEIVMVEPRKQTPNMDGLGEVSEKGQSLELAWVFRGEIWDIGFILKMEVILACFKKNSKEKKRNKYHCEVFEEVKADGNYCSSEGLRWGRTWAYTEWEDLLVTIWELLPSPQRNQRNGSEGVKGSIRDGKRKKVLDVCFGENC